MTRDYIAFNRRTNGQAMTMRRLRSGTRRLATLFLVLSAGVCHAQEGTGLFETMAPQRGVVPFGTYSIDKLESINITSRALQLTFPLASFAPGNGGFTYGIGLVYNSELYDVGYQDINVEGTTYPNQSVPRISQWGGWKYSYSYQLWMDSIQGPDNLGCPLDSMGNPTGPANVYWRLNVIFPDGSHHTLIQDHPTDGNDNPNGNGYFALDPAGIITDACPGGSVGTPAATTMKYHSTDGTYLRLEVTSNSLNGSYWFNQPWTLYFADGRTVAGKGQYASRIQDSNGNGVNISQTLNDCLTIYGSCGPGTPDLTVHTVLDDDIVDGSTGHDRQITLEHVADSMSGAILEDNIKQTGYNGVTLTTRVVYTSVSVYGDYTPETAGNQPWGPGSVLAISDIYLPTVGTYTPRYQFSYHSGTIGHPNWGELATMTLPSGAAVTYEYLLHDSSITRTLGGMTSNPVTRKTVSHDGQSDTWNYNCYGGCSFDSPWNCGANCTVIQAPDGALTRYDYFSPYNRTMTRGIIFKTTFADGSTDEKLWWNNRPYGSGPEDMANPYVRAQIRSVVHSGAPAQAAMTTFTLDKSGNAVTSEECGFVTYNSTNVPHNSGGDINASSLPSCAAARTTTSVFVRTTATQAGDGDISTIIGDDSNAYWHFGPEHWNLARNTKVADSSGTAAAAAFGYDGNAYGSSLSGPGNLTTEWHWDSTTTYSSSSFLSTPTSLGGSRNAIATARAYSSGNLTSMVDPNGVTTKYDYPSGSPYVSCITQAYVSGSSCSHLTDGSRHFSLLHDPSTGLLTKMTDVDNQVENNYTFDDAGRLLTADEAGERQTSYTYEDADLRIVKAADEFAHGDGALVSVTTYDQLGQPALSQQLTAATQDPHDTSAGIKQRHYSVYGTGNSLYELMSNPYETTGDETYGWTMTRFDQMKRPICVQLFTSTGGTMPSPTTSCPAGGTSGATTISYDYSSTTTTDPAGVARVTTADALGRLTTVTENNGITTTYAYDATGNLLTVQPDRTVANCTVGGVSANRQFVYDSLGRLASACNPETANGAAAAAGTISYTYDKNGNLTEKLDPRSAGVTIAYNSLNQPISKTYSGVTTPTVTYSYGTDESIDNHTESNYPFGRLTKVSNSASATVYRYDALGRTQSSKQTTASTPYIFGYSYYPAGLASEVYPSLRSVVTGYDGVGRPLGSVGILSGNSTTYAQGVSYAAHGAPRQVKMDNGNITEDMTFNPQLHPVSITAAGSSTQLLKLEYGYNDSADNGNVATQRITRLLDTGQQGSWTQAYGYDTLNRLTCANETPGGTATTCTSSNPGWQQGYGYDINGNQWAGTPLGALPGLTSQTPQAYGWFGSTTTTSGLYSGSQNNQVLASQGWTYDAAGNVAVIGSTLGYSYDAENRQVSSTLNGSTTSYAYDGDGRRVTKQTGSGPTTIYVYDAFGNLAADYPGTSSPNQTKYLIADALGSTRLEIASGSPVSCTDSLPFGQDLTRSVNARPACFPAAGFTAGEVKFTGKERDSESGLDYFGARYMSSAQGRFTSPDPVAGSIFNPQSLNAYSYVWNNPLRFTDPTGMVVSWEDSEATCKKGESVCRTGLQRQYENRIQQLQNSKNKGDQAKGNALASTYNELQNATEVFHVVREEGSGSGELTYRGIPGNLYVEMKGSGSAYGHMPDVQKLAHEFQHGGQFLGGLLGFTNISGKWRGYRDDLVDEANAFMAGFMAEGVGRDQSKFLQGLAQAAQAGVQAVVDKLDSPGSLYRGRATQQLPITTIPPSVYAVPRSK